MSTSLFAAVEMAPRDPILGLTEAFNADTRTDKVNLGVGVYYNDDGKLPLLTAVKAAEEARLKTQPPRGYQPIDGNAAYNQAVRELLFGAGSERASNGSVVTIQALGGTGALKVGADYLKQLLPQSTLYISDPSWENHRALFSAAGFPVETYPYYDPATRGVNFAAMRQKLATLPPASIVLLHACCHNPTGADLTTEEWTQVATLCKEKNLVPFLDMAYQGFADGIEPDTAAVRAFSAAGAQFFVSSSFSKNFSLYGERVGALSIVTASKEEAGRVLSQVKRVIRTNYSNPPTHGGAIVAAVLTSPELRKLWEDELTGMRERIRAVRQGLADALKAARAAQDFSFIVKQRGMFSYTGLSKDQVERLKTEFGIYAVASGRINVAALNSKNLPVVAEAIAAVVK
ncbi:MAG: aspartate/tyrosine/aromatic aminotransferase [Zoogloeaceae bacterium]|jgi:aromatic-amino-acid transaminase|nr:aspartate/tyrosine/aromatic aminotransferase [Zoogloeaceae bacterium]